jgi:protein-S-isoprenylcysteine O-methyltransferase Ste14
LRPAFTTDPLANTLFIFTVVVWLLSELQQAVRRRSNAEQSDRNSLFVLRLCIFGGVLLGVLALRIGVTYFGFNPFSLGVGLSLMWIGTALRWWSFWSLGRYFTFTVMTSPDQPILCTGPYRYLRHPSYAALLLALLGVGVTFGNWLSVIALAGLPALGLVYRIRVEEAALSTALGNRYTEFAATRKRIVPLLW